MAGALDSVEVARAAAIGRVVAYISHHLGEAFSRQDLADLAAMNKRTFARVFQTVMGVGVTEFMRTARVAHAKHLLDTTELPVAQVMRLAGFTSTDAGRRAFVGIERIAPLLYRDRRKD